MKDPEVCDPIRFLREREIVHYQRFGEALRIVQDNLDSRNFYAFNPNLIFGHWENNKFSDGKEGLKSSFFLRFCCMPDILGCF